METGSRTHPESSLRLPSANLNSHARAVQSSTQFRVHDLSALLFINVIVLNVPSFSPSHSSLRLLPTTPHEYHHALGRYSALLNAIYAQRAQRSQRISLWHMSPPPYRGMTHAHWQRRSGKRRRKRNERRRWGRMRPTRSMSMRWMQTYQRSETGWDEVE